jgi:hypothetical protein
MTITLSTQLFKLLQSAVVLAIFLHACALAPQWRARYFLRRFLHVTTYGLVLAVAQATLLALTHAGLADGAADALWSLAGALLLNVAVGAQNVLAVVALVRLHRGFAVVAHRLQGFVAALLWTSAALTAGAAGFLRGWW